MYICHRAGARPAAVARRMRTAATRAAAVRWAARPAPRTAPRAPRPLRRQLTFRPRTIITITTRIRHTLHTPRMRRIPHTVIIIYNFVITSYVCSWIFHKPSSALSLEDPTFLFSNTNIMTRETDSTSRYFRRCLSGDRK